jgi:hypothetical protein
MMQNLKKNMLFLSKRHSGSAKLLYKYIVYELLFTENPYKFQRAADIIFQSQTHVGPEKLTYLRSLIQIKEKWATAFMPAVFNAGTHTTSRAESVNAQIKRSVNAQSKLTDIFSEMSALAERTCQQQQVKQHNQTQLFLNHPLLKDLYELYSRHAFEFMMHQYMMSHECSLEEPAQIRNQLPLNR